jgi:PhnB protein
VSPYVLYEDAEAAVEYLTRAFGFEERLRSEGAAGRVHVELVLDGDGLVMVGQAGEGFRSPKSLGAEPPPVLIHVYVEDVEALHARARAASAVDLSELTDSPQGDRRFSASDPEGHACYLAQRVR